jgi:hypothetical protein
MHVFPGNLNKMLAKAQKAQAQMQQEIAAMQVEASAGGGAVTATVDGTKNLLALTISQELADEKDPQLIAELVVTAIQDAARQIDERTQAKMSAMMGSLGLPPGMGF